MTPPRVPSEHAGKDLTVATVCFFNEGGDVLVVRKRGTTRFMLPGGKLEQGETPVMAACRECAEELGLTLVPDHLRLLGSFSEAAANEVGWIVHSTVFLADLPAPPEIDREIEEMRWVPVAAASETSLAPLLEKHVMPALASHMRLTGRATSPTIVSE